MLMITDDDIQLLAEIRCEYRRSDEFERPYNEVLKKAMKAFRILQNVPDEHGDLVDMDTVLFEMPCVDGSQPPMRVTVADALEPYHVPVIIKAERKDDDSD